MIKYQFENLLVWQKSIDLIKRVYEITKYYPREEQFGLVSQIRRAAVSVPVNIAEGRGRHSTKDYVHFLYNARGSLYELITLLRISLELNIMTKIELEELDTQCRNIGGMLSGLINSMKYSKL